MTESDFIQPEDLPAEIQHERMPDSGLSIDFPPEGICIDDLERELIIKAMERTGWVIGKAAPLLGMTYKTLQYRLEKYAIAKPEKMTHNPS